MLFANVRFPYALAALICAALSGPAAAAEFAVARIIVPSQDGSGTTDTISGTLAQEMVKALNDGTVIVENKPSINTDPGYVVNVTPDRETPATVTFAHAANPNLPAKRPYNTDKDLFEPVSLIAHSFNVVVVNPKSGINSIADLIAAARAKPGTVNYGTFGPGTSAHLAGELFNELAGVRLIPVHYRGAQPAITNLLNGTIQVTFTTVASARPFIQSGQVKALAVTSAARTQAFPDVPTVAEAGVPNYAAESWYGLFVPAKTPADAITLLNRCANKAIHTPAFEEFVENEGLIVDGAPVDLVRDEEERWRNLVDGIKIE